MGQDSSSPLAFISYQESKSRNPTQAGPTRPKPSRRARPSAASNGRPTEAPQFQAPAAAAATDLNLRARKTLDEGQDGHTRPRREVGRKGRVCSLGLLLEVRDAGAHGLLDLRLPLSRRHGGGGIVVVGAHEVPVLGVAAAAGPVAPRGLLTAADAVFSLGAEETREHRYRVS